MEEGGFDAVFVGVGAQRGRQAEIPAGDAGRVVDAVSLLHGLEDGSPAVLGRTVVVYGGGDTAMDAARTAERLGATETVVVYRRNRDRMPAHDEEVEDALAEGVRMRWLSTVSRVEGGRLVVERMELDADGFPQPTGELEELEADSLVLALGQDADLALLDGVDGVRTDGGVVAVDADQRTGHPGVFAGGDVVGGERTITAAVGEGRRAAAAIDAWLDGREPGPRPSGRSPPSTGSTPGTTRTPPAPSAPASRPSGVGRPSTRWSAGSTTRRRLFEARRCMSCGNCFECDNCFGVCPDNAVIKLGPGRGYEFDLDFCKGCGICVEECPCGAIDLVPEPR